MSGRGLPVLAPGDEIRLGGQAYRVVALDGTSARLAVMHARRQIRKGERFDHESIIGTHFLAEVVATTRVGAKPAVVTTVAGRAWLTSIGQYGYDADDPFPEGYTLSDTWHRAI